MTIRRLCLIPRQELGDNSRMLAPEQGRAVARDSGPPPVGARPGGVVLTLILVLFSAIACASNSDGPVEVRIATYNVSLSDNTDSSLISKLEAGSDHARRVAAIIQVVRPDILVLNEFDYDDDMSALTLFHDQYLAVGQFGGAGVSYEYRYAGPVNTGLASGLDLDLDGRLNEPEDAFGFGRYPGQYGMALLSRYPLEFDQIRRFQTFLWASMPDAGLPATEGDVPYYDEPALAKIRLSSKSHWDIPVRVGNQTLHALLAHPTPPGFDGPEDRNGRRNFAENRLLKDYVESARYLTDDQGRRGGLDEDALFFIAGDLNADPSDGGSRPGAIGQLLNSDKVAQYPAPRSRGGIEAASRQGGANLGHKGDPAEDTSDFSDDRVGNLRVDYVLPSAAIKVRQSGVFWPAGDEPRSKWVTVSDHRLVWVDITLPEPGPKPAN